MFYYVFRLFCSLHFIDTFGFLFIVLYYNIVGAILLRLDPFFGDSVGDLGTM